MKYLYAPGCALMSYKPHLADKLKEIIESRYGKVDYHTGMLFYQTISGKRYTYYNPMCNLCLEVCEYLSELSCGVLS